MRSISVLLLPALCAGSLMLTATPVRAADNADEAALSLADSTPEMKQASRPWRLAAEGAVGRSRQRYGVNDFNIGRLSLDGYYDAVLAPAWRLVLADRIDRYYQSGINRDSTINTMKEAYVSWHPEGIVIVDAGRINVRNGAAFGYNPTDFFRSGAIRSVVSIDPNSLRENRLGTVMLRGQVLLPGGSVTVIAAPKLTDKPSDAAFSPDFGATSRRDRWMITASTRYSEAFNPQFLIFGGKGQSAQGGLNLSALLNQSTVGYVEWAGGSGGSLYDNAIGAGGDQKFRQRVSTGLTYTTANKLSLTAEYEYNGAGMNRGQWSQLGPSALENYVRYRLQVQDLQELPTRSSIFLFASWQDAMMPHLDLRGFIRYNTNDQSRLNWLEARYHLTRVDLSLQLQHNAGNPFTEYGALPERQMVQGVVTYFF